MYTNIDTDHAVKVISTWLDNLKDQLLQDFPLSAVKAAMILVMRNNLFEWGNMYFLQLLGTAMGTSAACMWATIYFATHEINTLIPRYTNNLLIFRRFIDDIFGICIDNGTANAWESFQQDTNDFCILIWEFKELATSVDFLDLTISIKQIKIATNTYQKKLNLYQYIMPRSNHPPGMMQGIIYSLMQNYHRKKHRIQ